MDRDNCVPVYVKKQGVERKEIVHNPEDTALYMKHDGGVFMALALVCLAASKTDTTLFLPVIWTAGIKKHVSGSADAVLFCSKTVSQSTLISSKAFHG